MSNSNNIVEIFEAAKHALLVCACQDDPNKDGCYRCVYSYHRQREMEKVSRIETLEIVIKILEHLENLNKSPNRLASIEILNKLDSPLERNFIEALKRLKVGNSRCSITSTMVNRKPGYVLTTDSLTYYIETQVTLTKEDGVLIPSKPDFVIQPARNQEQQPAVAIFTDGYKYHKDITSEDAVKRMALMNAGYIVWSITWQDLEIDQSSNYDALDLLKGVPNGHFMEGPMGFLDQKWPQSRQLRQHLHCRPLELLVRYLRNPEPEIWKQAVFTELLQMFNLNQMLTESLYSKLYQSVVQTLPRNVANHLISKLSESAAGGVGNWIDESHQLNVFVIYPKNELSAMNPDSIRVATQLFSHRENLQSENFQQSWQGVLWLMNRIQFLKNAWWVHDFDQEDELYSQFEDDELYQFIDAEQAPESSQTQSESDEAWELILEITELDPNIITTLRNHKIPAPEPMFELANENGKVIAQAELAWPAPKIAVFLCGDENYKIFLQYDWQIIFDSDVHWVDRIVSALSKG